MKFKVGDLVTPSKELCKHSWWTEGKRYPILEIADGCIWLRDDDNEAMDYALDSWLWAKAKVEIQVSGRRR